MKMSDIWGDMFLSSFQPHQEISPVVATLMNILPSEGLRRTGDSEVSIYQTSMNSYFQTPERMPEHTTQPAYSAEYRMETRSKLPVRPKGEHSPDTPIHSCSNSIF